MRTTLHHHNPLQTQDQDSPARPSKAGGKRWLWAVEVILVIGTAALISLVHAITPPVAQAVPVTAVWMQSAGDTSVPDAATALRQGADDAPLPPTF